MHPELITQLVRAKQDELLAARHPRAKATRSPLSPRRARHAHTRLPGVRAAVGADVPPVA